MLGPSQREMDNMARTEPIFIDGGPAGSFFEDLISLCGRLLVALV